MNSIAISEDEVWTCVMQCMMDQILLRFEPNTHSLGLGLKAENATLGNVSLGLSIRASWGCAAVGLHL